MPIFEYRCKGCGHVSSFLEKSGSQKAHPCENCASNETEKIFSTFSAQVAGAQAACGMDRDSCPSGASCADGACPYSQQA